MVYGLRFAIRGGLWRLPRIVPLFSKDGKTSPSGFEPPTFGFGGQEEQSVSKANPITCENQENCFATCSAILMQKDPDLTSVIKAWPELPEHIKQTIRTLITITTKKSQ